MSEFDQLRTTTYAPQLRTTKAGNRVLDWPVLGIAVALVSVVAWDLALLWLAVKLCRIVFL